MNKDDQGLNYFWSDMETLSIEWLKYAIPFPRQVVMSLCSWNTYHNSYFSNILIDNLKCFNVVLFNNPETLLLIVHSYCEKYVSFQQQYCSYHDLDVDIRSWGSCSLTCGSLQMGCGSSCDWDVWDVDLPPAATEFNHWRRWKFWRLMTKSVYAWVVNTNNLFAMQ